MPSHKMGGGRHLESWREVCGFASVLCDVIAVSEPHTALMWDNDPVHPEQATSDDFRALWEARGRVTCLQMASYCP